MNKPKTALITGATSGFGLEFAKLFAKAGYDLIITAESASHLATVQEQLIKDYSVKVWHEEFNLSQPGAGQKLYNWTTKQKLAVDVLVNNAGIGLYGKFADHKLEDEQALINLDVNAIADLCHLYIPGMIKRGGGKILNVASIAGFQAGPYYATYFASKAFVLLFSEALQTEYAPQNIQVTALCPGVSRTNFFKRANMREDAKLLQSYMMTAQQVAQAGFDGLMKGKTVVVPGLRNKFVALGYRVFPRKTITKITKNLVAGAAE